MSRRSHRRLRAVGEPIFGLTAQQVSMGRLLEQLFETTRRFDMQLQPQLVLLQKTMVVVEGVARQLDPAFDVWEASRPVIERWMLEHLGPEAGLKDAAEGLTSMGGLAQNLPAIAERYGIDCGATRGRRGSSAPGIRCAPSSRSQVQNSRNLRLALLIAAGALSVLAIGVL